MSTTASADQTATAAVEPPHPETRKVSVMVVSDLVWPWCWIGKRNLETAIETTKKNAAANGEAPIEFSVQWQPFQLRPGTPLTGVQKEPRVVRPDGSNSRVNPRLGQAGRRVGIDFTGLTDRAPNTLASHVALHYAAEEGGAAAQNELQELLFKAYFTDGVFLDAKNVAELAGKVEGLTVEGALEAVNDENLTARVKLLAGQLSRNGITGVPFFFINQRPAFSGAQPPAAFEAAFAAALQKDDEDAE